MGKAEPASAMTMTFAELPEYARVSHVAELLGLSRSEVYRMVETGELPSTRVSETGVRIPKAELSTWLRERTFSTMETPQRSSRLALVGGTRPYRPRRSAGK
jgi:excisionase family DNA binding protein